MHCALLIFYYQSHSINETLVYYAHIKDKCISSFCPYYTRKCEIVTTSFYCERSISAKTFSKPVPLKQYSNPLLLSAYTAVKKQHFYAKCVQFGRSDTVFQILLFGVFHANPR